MPSSASNENAVTFKVLSKPWNVPASAANAAFLITDNWDDFGYKTTYSLVVFDAEGNKHEVGYVKVGSFQCDKATKRIALPKAFEQLDASFFSVGQDDSYYEKLNGLGHDTRRQILHALNDVAANPELWEKVRDLDITTVSLLRERSTKSVTGQFRRLAQGGIRLTSYHFTFDPPKRLAAGSPPFQLSFDVRPETYPPTNIHVLIGRNGVGKTYMLNLMMRSLIADEASSRQSGAFSVEGTNEDSFPFANLVSVTFSAFDPFLAIPSKVGRSQSIKYSYVGLRRTTDTGKGIGTPKTPEMLAREFVSSVQSCIRGAKLSRWRRALKVLEGDPIFKAADVATLAEDEAEDFDKSADQLFGKLSSGHKIVLLTITRLVEVVEEKTLVLIDEPEAHLHPPLLSAFIRSLSELLIDRNGVAIIATHSPVVLQEVPKNCVWKLRRTGVESKIERPEIETFGENVGILTREVFGLEVAQSGFHKLLSEAVSSHDTYEAALAHFNNDLGAEARAILRGLFLAKESANNP